MVDWLGDYTTRFDWIITSRKRNIQQLTNIMGWGGGVFHGSYVADHHCGMGDFTSYTIFRPWHIPLIFRKTKMKHHNWFEIRLLPKLIPSLILFLPLPWKQKKTKNPAESMGKAIITHESHDSVDLMIFRISIAPMTLSGHPEPRPERGELPRLSWMAETSPTRSRLIFFFPAIGEWIMIINGSFRSFQQNQWIIIDEIW